MAEVVYWVQDLLFVSKIRAVAQELGLQLKSVRDAAALADGAKSAKVVIVDLRIAAAVDALGQVPQGVTKIGFIDHERTDVMERAQSLGCRALAKGRFANELPLILGNL